MLSPTFHLNAQWLSRKWNMVIWPPFEGSDASLDFHRGPAVGLCLQSEDANVYDVQFKSLHPWWNTGAEARERNESCAVNHSLPHRRRGETHAESNNCIQKKKKKKRKKKRPQHTIKPNTFPPGQVQSVARLDRNGFLTETEWHISTLCFFSHTQISQADKFPLRALLCPGLLVSTNLHLGLPTLGMLEGEDAKWKGGRTMIHCNTYCSHCRAFPSLTLQLLLGFTCMMVNSG